MAPTFRPYLHSGHIVAFSHDLRVALPNPRSFFQPASNYLLAIAARLYSITYALHTETLYILPLRLRLQLTDCHSARSRPVSITLVSIVVGSRRSRIPFCCTACTPPSTLHYTTVYTHLRLWPSPRPRVPVGPPPQAQLSRTALHLTPSL